MVRCLLYGLQSNAMTAPYRNRSKGLRNDSTVADLNLLAGLARLRSDGLHLVDDLHAAHHGSKDDVLAIKPRGHRRADEELRS